jgi:hypothetical protein
MIYSLYSCFLLTVIKESKEFFCQNIFCVSIQHFEHVIVFHVVAVGNKYIAVIHRILTDKRYFTFEKKINRKRGANSIPARTMYT